MKLKLIGEKALQTHPMEPLQKVQSPDRTGTMRDNRQSWPFPALCHRCGEFTKKHIARAGLSVVCGFRESPFCIPLHGAPEGLTYDIEIEFAADLLDTGCVEA